MNLSFKLFQKAAATTAAFCFLLLPAVAGAKNKSVETAAFTTVKKKVVNLLIQKQKKQALSILTDFIAAEPNKPVAKEARELKTQIAKKFLTKEAQESYEMSLNLTLENPKEAKKNNEDCLARDPENFDCIVQGLRLTHREKQKKQLDIDEMEKVNKYFELAQSNWILLSSTKNTEDFKSNDLFSIEAGQKLNENKLIFAILEVDRAMLVKNFSKVKDLLSAIEVDFSDWPELSYFKNKIEYEFAENKTANSTEAVAQYLNKCKSLSKTVARKYRYDFDLCLRGSF